MMIQKRFGTCSKDCYGCCVLEGTWDDNKPLQKLRNVTALKDHPFTQGFLCPKFQYREKLLYHDKRLKHSLIREGPKPTNDFIPISKEKTNELLIQKINRTIYLHGAPSILYAGYSGNQGALATKYPHRFFTALGATITGGGICNEGGCAGLQQMFGTYSLTNPFQLTSPDCHLIVVWNSDLTENNNHAFLLVKKAIKNGAKLIVVDSRKTKLAKLANIHIQPNPLTEYLVAGLLVKLLITNEQIDGPFVNAHTSGYASVTQKLSKLAETELVSKTGLVLKEVQSLVQLLRDHRHHTMFMVGYGLQKDFFGGKMIQSIALLQVLLGNIGKTGSGLIYSQSDYKKAVKSEMLSVLLPPDILEKRKIIDMMDLAAELESGNYKILIISGFNPANSLPNQARLRRALMNEDLFIVSLEAFLTETTRYADLVIPVKYDLETNDLVFSYYIPGVSQTEAGPCPYPDCTSHVEFYNALASEFTPTYPELRFPIQLFQKNSAQLVEEMLSRAGPEIKNSVNNKGYFLFQSENDVYYSNLNFPTPDSKIDISPVNWIFDEELRQQQEGRVMGKKNLSNDPVFQLITPNHPRLLHSQLIELNPQFEDDFGKIYITPEEAIRCNFKSGENVIVYNSYFEAEMKLEISDRLFRNMALIYSGGPDRDPKFPNANHFTPDLPEILANSGSFNSGIVYLKSSKINNG